FRNHIIGRSAQCGGALHRVHPPWRMVVAGGGHLSSNDPHQIRQANRADLGARKRKKGFLIMPLTRAPGPSVEINKDQAFQFLKLIDPAKREFTFQTFAEKGDTESNARPRVIHTSSIASLRREHHFGAGIYVAVNETDGVGRKTKNIVRVRAVFSENDQGHNDYPITPSMTVETSPRHFHDYWLVEVHWPADEQGKADFAAVMERMIQTYHSDPGAKDLSRVLRVPGFLHRKADKGPVTPFMVRIVSANDKRYTRAELLAAFPPVEREPKREAPRSEWRPRDDDDERIREALNYIDPDPRDLWRDIGMALKDHYGESGRSLWDQWSRRSKKFNERDQNKAWRSFKREGITVGTLFHHAQQGGWQTKHHHNN